MRHGDLISVRYRDRHSDKVEWSPELYYGFVMETDDDSKASMLKMWCITTGSVHIVSARLDLVEVVSVACPAG